MITASRREWLIPAGLVLLSLVPMIAGTARLVDMATAHAITPENARFLGDPVPGALHIVSVAVFSLLGAFQFVPGIRRRHPRWHRMAGRLLVPAGLVASLSGLWLSHFYELPPTDGVALYLIRMVVGTAMTAALVLGLLAVRRRDFVHHEAWMMRAYGLGIGAGTQVLTHLPWVLTMGLPDVATRAVLMGAGWAINIAVVEWILATRTRTVRMARI